MVDRMVCCKSLIKLLSSTMRKPFSFETLVFVLLFLEGLRSCLCTNSSFGRCIEGERLALLTLKQSLEDPSNRLLSWSGEDCCHWRGVSCSTSTGRVILLDLRVPSYASYYYKTEWRPIISYNTSEKLSAVEVHPSLGELKQLEYLDLSGNDFKHSPIPEFLGSLKSLRYLNLSSAGFSGNIPHQLGNLTSLRVLDLSYEYYVIYTVDEPLYSSSLQWASSLSSLEYLDLSLANLGTAFDLIHVLSQLPSLQQLRLQHCGIQNVHFQPRVNFTFLASVRFLYLEGNELSGQIPAAFHNLTALRGLDLGYQVGGPIYADSLGWLSRLSSLQHLDMSSVNLSNALDLMQVLNTLPALRHLRLKGCLLENTHFTHGSANSTLFLSRIQFLDLSSNGFFGPIPNALKNMTAIKSLNLNGNGFNSSLPALGSKSLVYLNVRWNEFDSIEGGVVSILNRACSLYSLGLSNNYYRSDILIGKLNSSSCPIHDLEFLILESYPVSTNMPDWLGQLNRLKYLHLGRSSLTGSIPLSITELSNLRILDLSSNQLNGTIPDSLGSLSALEELDISSNKLSGTIPQSSGRLSALRKLDLSSNQYLRGTIPQSLGSLFALKHLDLSNNELSGIIPLSFGKSPFLSFLGLSNNQLNGSIPQSLGRLSSLSRLNISHNKLSGHVPESIGHLVNLLSLDISYNSLDGVLTESHLANLTNLFEFDVSSNNISGNPLPYIANTFSDIQTLLLGNNLLSGPIPNSLCKLQMIVLDLSKNNLSGEIPDCWDENLAVVVIDLSSNKLSRKIPSTLGTVKSIRRIHVNNNNLDGELPQSLKNLGDLQLLDLGDNKFSGLVPAWIGESFSTLRILRLRKNMFDGRIPLQLCQLARLKFLDLAENNLIGEIPSCLGNLGGMNETNSIFEEDYNSRSTPNQYDDWRGERVSVATKGLDLEYTKYVLQLLNMIDLSSNKLSGVIPKELCSLNALRGLNLSNNHLSGKIPNRIGELKLLDTLDLSNNQLFGVIPPNMSDLSFLSHLNLSNNNLSGKIPTGNQLQTLNDPSIYGGNLQLCGPPLLKKCDGDDQNPTSFARQEKEDDKKERILFWFFVTSGYAIGLWGVIGILVMKKKWRNAFFGFFDKTKENVLVAVEVKVARLKQKTQKIRGR